MADRNLEKLSNEALLKAEKRSKIICYLLMAADIAIVAGIVISKMDKNNFTMIAAFAGLVAVAIEHIKQAKNFKAERLLRGI